MMQPSLRPENRQRSPDINRHWAEPVPLCMRSEAFAEDLVITDAWAQRPAATPGATGWGGAVAAPLLGLARAAVRAVVAR